jgi:hypothetical protein
MPDIDLMQECADAVTRDVAATTSLHISLSTWLDPENGIGAVVHEVGARPTSPVWEASGCLEGGDCLAVHPPTVSAGPFPDMGPSTEVTISIADATQNLVHVLLWERGLDPTWPPCPAHHGEHPLRARSSHSPPRASGPAAPGVSTASWQCPSGATSITIGKLEPLGP